MNGIECVELDRHCMIRVEVHGLKGFPSLPRYLEALRATAAVPVTALVEAFSEPCPFRYNSHASLRMYFSTPDKGNRIFISPWGPLQQWRRAYGVVILVDGAQTPLATPAEQSSLKKDIGVIIGLYPDSVCHIIVVAPTQESQDFVAALDNVVIVPANIHADVTDTSLRQLIASVSLQLATDLTMLFRQRIVTIAACPERDCIRSTRKCKELSTIIDQAEDNDSRQQRLDKLEARACKVQGDLCMMVGGFLDAVRLYETAQLRSSDPLWQAAALESTACAIVNLLRNPETSKMYKMSEAVELLVEAAQIFATRAGVIQMEGEVLLELAELSIQQQRSSSGRLDGLRSISAAVAVAMKIPTTRKEGADIYRSAAMICSRHGWRRKAAFYLERGGDVDTEVGKDYALALHELVTALQFSGTPLAVQGNNFVLTTPKAAAPCEWPGTMQTLLGCLLRIVEKMSVLQKTMLSQLCVYMLSVDVAFDEGLPARQLKLQGILQSASEAFPHHTPLCIQPLRFLQRVRKVPMEVPLRPVAAPDPKAAKWEYNPRIKVEPFEDFVAGTVCRLEALIENPFTFPLELTDVTVCAEGCAHAPVVVSSVRIPRRSTVAVMLHVQPLTSGVMTITAVQTKWRSTHSYPLRLPLLTPLVVDVISAIALLTVDIPHARHLALCPGQIESATLRLHNIGDIAISQYRVEIHSASCTLATCRDCHHNTRMRLVDTGGAPHAPILASETIVVAVELMAAQVHSPTEPTESLEIRVFYGDDNIVEMTTGKDSFFRCQRKCTVAVPLALLPGLEVRSVRLSECARNLTVRMGNASLTAAFHVDGSHSVRNETETVLTLPVTRQNKGVLPVAWEGDARNARGKLLISLPLELRTMLADELDTVAVTAEIEPNAVTFRTTTIRAAVDNRSKFPVRVLVRFAMPRASPGAVDNAVVWGGQMAYGVDPGRVEGNAVGVTFLTAGEYYMVVEVHGTARRICHSFTIHVTEE